VSTGEPIPRDLRCPTCGARGVSIASAAWVLSVGRRPDTRCRACGALVRFPVAARPVAWLLVVPCLVLIAVEWAAAPAFAFLLMPLTVLTSLFVPAYLWPLSPVLRDAAAAIRRGDRICPRCRQPGVPYGWVVWDAWAAFGATRCARCGALVRLSRGALALAAALFCAWPVLLLFAWAYLPGPLTLLLAVALPVAWLAIPPRFARLRTAPERG
jgi:hypothetical protein